MMIEEILCEYLTDTLEVPVLLEHDSGRLGQYVVLEKTGASMENQIKQSTIAFQSYADSLYQAASLNEVVKSAVMSAVELPQITGVHLNSDYNYTDTTKKKYRYQAVFSINHY